MPVDIARVVSHLGDAFVLIALGVAVGVWLLRRRRPRLLAAVPLTALVLASLTENLAKQLIDRPRPPFAYRLVAESNASFPSGHTTAAAALLMAIALVLVPAVADRRARVGVITGCGLLAAAVGLARLVLGVHWLTDVIAGWFFGTAWALAIVLVAERIQVVRLRRVCAPWPARA